jgi:hypothetical protein
VLVGAVAAASGGQLEAARVRAKAAEDVALAVGAEASSVVRVDTSAAAALGAMIVEHEATLVVTGWRKAALAADMMLGGQNMDLVAVASVPVLAVLAAHGDYRRVVLVFDESDLDERRGAERDLAVAVAVVAAAGARGHALVVAPDGEAAHEIARLIDDDTEVVVDTRSRRDAVAAIARADDLVIMPARPGGSPLHRDAVAVASLPVGCSVCVPARPHSTAGLVTGMPTLVGSRR